jgi:uncharacterized Zn-binding protein involved in type VI secretion
MPPIARVADQTVHGTPLGPGPGSLNVLIRGKPAWRVGPDLHQCPLSDGSKPHVGGPTVGGCPTVLINGCPAAMVGDKITEAGTPNAIASGEPTVRICG